MLKWQILFRVNFFFLTEYIEQVKTLKIVDHSILTTVCKIYANILLLLINFTELTSLVTFITALMFVVYLKLEHFDVDAHLTK